MMTLADNYTAVQERIHQAATRAGRDPAGITLVAVTKTWPAAVVATAYAAGMRHFGENRAGELAQKREAITAQLGPDAAITWHAIGTLQSRKAKMVADYGDIFHALDRLKIARKLAQHLAENGRHLPVFLEVNVSGEASKSGFDCTRWETNREQMAALRQAFETVNDLPGLAAVGLMTMAPWDVAPQIIRAVFRRTWQLAGRLQTDLALAAPLQLSMGMTDDFEIAIEEGATHVRVGRALFGERP